jgi:hypothetical protein
MLKKATFSPAQPRRAKTRRSASKAAGESKPEAYPQGYVEDFDEPRTPLAGFFSVLLYLHPLNFFIGRQQLVPDLHHQLEGHIGFL